MCAAFTPLGPLPSTTQEPREPADKFQELTPPLKSQFRAIPEHAGGPPVKATVCGFPIALSVTERLAVREPAASGVKVTAILQLAPAARVAAQVLVSLKSPAYVPLMLIPEIFKTAVPTLVRVIVDGELAEPTAMEPNVTEVGENETAGDEPLPVKATVCGLPIALSVTEMLAVREPAATGINVTAILQLAPAARVEAQVLVSLKSPAFVPLILIPEIFKTALPTLVKVIVDGELGEPTAMEPNVTDVGENETAGDEPLPTVNVCVELLVAPKTSVATA
jgi:hypothetical protein